MDNDNERSRILVAVTPAELDDFMRLARACNTSISALGQAAIRGMMAQARAGATPLVPPARPGPQMNSYELWRAGFPTSGEVLAAEYEEACKDQP